MSYGHKCTSKAEQHITGSLSPLPFVSGGQEFFSYGSGIASNNNFLSLCEDNQASSFQQYSFFEFSCNCGLIEILNLHMMWNMKMNIHITKILFVL